MLNRKQQIEEFRKQGKTFQEIGNMFGISRQRVHQVFIGFKPIKKKNIFEIILSSLFEIKKTKHSFNYSVNGLDKYNSEGLGNFSGRGFLAELVRKRDNWTCQICGKKWEQGKRRFDVHHLNPENESDRSYRNYKKLNEMITLCHKCHLNLDHIKEKMAKGQEKYQNELSTVL